MTLKKKIILGSLISFTIIAILVLVGYANFIETKKEIRFLELSDTLRNKSLQLRRHEKNFFLYRDITETRDVHTYLEDLKAILKKSRASYSTDKLLNLEISIEEYEKIFSRIELIAGNFQNEFDKLKPLLSQNPDLIQLAESTYLESPLINAKILKKFIPSNASNPAIRNLHKLNTEIIALRKSGEEILNISKAFDKSAREKVERYISLSHTAAIFLFPLLLLIGLATSFIISNDILNRLKILTGAIKKTGKGEFSLLTIPEKQDEVGELIKTFNKMEHDLVERDYEIESKNEELLLSKKLASLGTLASGVAHELNNPLNNIYTTAQRLIRKSKDEIPLPIKKGLDDIFSQTMRVKRIVGELLEFASGREPQFREFELNILLSGVYKQISNVMNTEDIVFLIDSDLSYVGINADPEQLERVFINLFTNAVETMSGVGTLTVSTISRDDYITVSVADTGNGIPRDLIEKIFEPFFTTKDKGTGLGLAIVLNIIKKHKGEIRVECEENKGTVFTIILPKENK